MTVLEARLALVRVSFADLQNLTKPRITALVVVTTSVGFYVASPASIDWILLLHTLFGSMLVCSGSSTLNMHIEVEQDRLMVRTRNRPMAANRLQPNEVLFFGAGLSFFPYHNRGSCSGPRSLASDR